jgi:hypothetical protein
MSAVNADNEQLNTEVQKELKTSPANLEGSKQIIIDISDTDEVSYRTNGAVTRSEAIGAISVVIDHMKRDIILVPVIQNAVNVLLSNLTKENSEQESELQQKLQNLINEYSK